MRVSLLSNSPSRFTYEQPEELAVPTRISGRELQKLKTLATTYALARGLPYVPAAGFLYPTLISLVHAPFTIFPALFPRSKFLLAQRLQPSHDVHYAQVTVDEKFLDEVRWGAPKASGRWTSSSVGRRSIGNSCGMEVFNRCALMPFSSLSLTGIERQSWHLGLFRSDCLLHEPEGGKEAWSNSTRHPPRVCRCLLALLLFTGSYLAI